MRKIEVSAGTRFDRTKEIFVRFVRFEVMFLYLGRFKLLLIHTYHRLIVGVFYSNSKIAEKKQCLLSRYVVTLFKNLKKSL